MASNVKPKKKLKNGGRMTAAQQKLVEDNLAVVDRCAKFAAHYLPNFVEIEEIIAAGRFGLCQAAYRFNPKLHANFTVYALKRIRGAIIDAFQGPRYPRRYVAMPEHWDESATPYDSSSGNEVTTRLPEALIDRHSVLDDAIEEQQCVVVSIAAGRAEATLDPAQAAVLALHIQGLSLAKIGQRQGCSRTAAHGILAAAKARMRAALLAELGGDEEAA